MCLKFNGGALPHKGLLEWSLGMNSGIQSKSLGGLRLRKQPPFLFYFNGVPVPTNTWGVVSRPRIPGRNPTVKMGVQSWHWCPRNSIPSLSVDFSRFPAHVAATLSSVPFFATFDLPPQSITDNALLWGVGAAVRQRVDVCVIARVEIELLQFQGNLLRTLESYISLYSVFVVWIFWFHLNVFVVCVRRHYICSSFLSFSIRLTGISSICWLLHPLILVSQCS
jgi:hypothetical protein